MKIVILASYAESLLNFRGHLLKAMVEAGHEVVALAPALDNELVVQLENMGVSGRGISLHRTGVNPLRDWQDYRALLHRLEQIKPDLILSYTVKPVIYGSLAASKVGVQQVYSLITGLGYAFMGQSLKDRMVGKAVRILYRQALKKNKRVFFQNPDDRNLFQQLGLLKSPEQAVVVNGSGIDTDYYRPVPLPVAPVFLLVARLLRDKGIEEYVAAAAVIKKSHPSTRFLLVGWLDTHPSAITGQDIEQWQRQSGIEYLGAVEDVREVMSQASVYVLPSYREGTPRTVLEAMAMGRPVITTDAPGCRETVVDGLNGRLVKVQDTETLILAMEQLLLDTDLREKMGLEGRKIAEERYDVHQVNRMILQNMGVG